MIGFWFGVGAMLAVGVADGLNHFFEKLTGKAATKMAEQTQVQQVTTNY